MIDEAIVLAGGLGTRLKEVVRDIPKPMAPVDGTPFLSYLLAFLAGQQIRKIILSVGYKAQVIKDYYGDHFGEISLLYSTEKDPLGTGGAIKKAMKFIDNDAFFAMNGDTLFRADLQKLASVHRSEQADVTIALKPMLNPQRYGTVAVDEEQKITGFREKQKEGSGFINGGMYLIHKPWMETTAKADNFSFEHDILEKHAAEADFRGLPFENYFIDIGIPEDYQKAQKNFKHFDGAQ